MNNNTMHKACNLQPQSIPTRAGRPEQSTEPMFGAASHKIAHDPHDNQTLIKPFSSGDAVESVAPRLK